MKIYFGGEIISVIVAVGAEGGCGLVALFAGEGAFGGKLNGGHILIN